MQEKNVTVVISGGASQQTTAGKTIRDLKAQFGKPSFVAKVNGESVSDDHVLSDYEFVTLAENVKGGC